MINEEKIAILATHLKALSPNDEDSGIVYELTPHSTILDVAHAFDLFSFLGELLRNKLHYAPDFKEAISIFVKDIENYQLQLAKFPDEQTATANNAYMTTAYWQTVKGMRTSLGSFVDALLVPYEQDGITSYGLSFEVLKDLGSAASYAYRLTWLKKMAEDPTKFIGANSKDDIPSAEYNATNAEDDNEESLRLPFKPLQWIGTPGEFGAYFNEMIDTGHLGLMRDRLNTVRSLNKFFEIRNDKGKLVSDTYLYKCFGEKQRQFRQGEFKLPRSDNYNK